jgi:virginiamycin B lyase
MTYQRYFIAVATIALLAGTACSQRSGPMIPPLANPAQTYAVTSVPDSAPDKVKVTFKEYKLPKTYGGPVHITRGPGSTNVLWFTEHGANALGTISTNGTIKERALTAGIGASVQPDPGAIDPLMQGAPVNAHPIPMITLPPTGNAPYGITAGSDKAMWFTNENASKNFIGKYKNSSAVQFAVKGPCCLQNIAPGPDGALWFPIGNSYDLSTNTIGKITMKGKVKLFNVSYGSVPANITAGPDKAMWFTEGGSGKIGRMTTSGQLTNEYALPSSGSQPVDIVKGPDGNLWFTEWYGNKIGRMTPKGKVKEFPVPSSGGLAGITVGPDKALWFCETDANKIGRITTSGAVTEYRIPTAGSRPFFITLGPDRALWFTEYGASKIGRVQVH